MSAPVPYRIVFVCLGNICRSPMAEIAMRALLEREGLAGDVQVTSAGTGDYHIGERADERAAATLRSRGYDPDFHRARYFAPADFGAADLIVALDRASERELRALAPGPDATGRVRLLRSFDPDSDPSRPEDRDVPDPYFGGPEGFETAMDLVEASCRGLLAVVRRELGHVS